MEYFNRNSLSSFPLAERKNKVYIERDRISSDYPVSPPMAEKGEEIARSILQARERGRSIMFVFGAHLIKNGLGPLLRDFIRRGWVSHLATNGAGVIHDWEFAYQGMSSEDVRSNVAQGKFGTWEETGLYINLALALGAYRGFGYGQSLGALISEQSLDIPPEAELEDCIAQRTPDPGGSRRGAALDLLELLQDLGCPPGPMAIPHPYRSYSLQAAAYEAHIPFTSHPMFGHDIIYTHRANRGAVIGRCADRDFLSFVRSVENLDEGVYLSIGSAVMSPMVFEKSLSMARNASYTRGETGGSGDIPLSRCRLYVADLQEATWDWNRGEPPMDNPAYYLRFMKTFHRMGCPLEYLQADNRELLVALYRALERLDR